jgi:hypothetical protein
LNQIPEQLKDFRNFLYLVWKHLNLPEPTRVQYDIAAYLQTSPRRCVIEAFRGVGKSYVTSAYVVWRLYLDPDIKVLVVSASKVRADDFSTFTQRLIREIPILGHLIPKEGQRDSKIAFDVAPAKASHSPSVKSVGITGQLAGSRADLIVADDIEVPNNSATQMMREKLAESIKEFDAVLKPDGKVVYLGTPQTEMSIYEVLPERGYEVRIWCARYPKENQRDRMAGRLAPMLQDDLDRDEKLQGAPTDPKRFDEADLIERELSYGRSGFALQFMLDTSLSDQDRYPLKLSDLIVLPTNNDKAPENVMWGRLPQNEIKDVPNVGLNGDKIYAPQQTVGDWIPYTGSVMAIDPSGRGKDETSYAVVKMLNGNLYVTKAGGLTGGYSPETLQALANIAKNEKVNMVIIESNFGDGMFKELLTPYLVKTHPVTMEEVRHSIQKEKRIIDTLEPVMNQHRLIIDPKVFEEDYKSAQVYPADKATRYMLFYQMTRLTRDKGALAQDDRLDALAMAVGYWVEQMAADADKQLQDRKSELLDAELDKFLENCFHVKHGGRVKSNTWISNSIKYL